MVREYYERICAGDQLRQNLIALRDALKEEKDRRKFTYLLGGDFSRLCALLKDEDPKVRRNAAAILGKMESEDLLPVLFDAYKNEKTLFIRADYLKAMREMDYRPVLGALRERLAQLRGREIRPEEQKHMLEEMRVLQEMVLRCEKKEGGHRFVGWEEPLDLILVTNRSLREVTARQIGSGKLTLLAGGIRIHGAKVGELRTIRTFREILFPVDAAAAGSAAKAKPDAQSLIGHSAKGSDENLAGETIQAADAAAAGQPAAGAHKAAEGQTEQAADRAAAGQPAAGAHKAAEGQTEQTLYRISAEQAAQIGASLAQPVLKFAKKLHQGDGAFRFRLEWKSQAESERKGVLLRRISYAIERASGGELLNSVSDYELEIRILGRRDGTFLPMVKLLTIPDRRFAYRRETVASSITPVNAALVAELARPYLKEGAQVLDPFCGVGTMLIERDRAVKAGVMYGVDIFGEAVEKAKENTERAGCKVYYVNKDFFAFEHGYLFDEIITDLPQVTANHPEQEIRGLYRNFLAVAGRYLQPEAVLVLYTTEPQLLLEGLRGQREYKIAEKHTFNEKNGTGVFILKRNAGAERKPT